MLVAEAASAALALHGGHEGAIDVLLTDVIMPQMSGANSRTTLGEESALKILFMSGYTDDMLAGYGSWR